MPCKVTTYLLASKREVELTNCSFSAITEDSEAAGNDVAETKVHDIGTAAVTKRLGLGEYESLTKGGIWDEGMKSWSP